MMDSEHLHLRQVLRPVLAWEPSSSLVSSLEGKHIWVGETLLVFDKTIRPARSEYIENLEAGVSLKLQKQKLQSRNPTQLWNAYFRQPPSEAQTVFSLQ